MKPLTRTEAIQSAIEHLNSNFGIGSVIRVEPDHYVSQRYGGAEIKRKIKVIRETAKAITIAARGHQTTIQLDPLAARCAVFEREIYKLLVSLKQDIDPDFRASNDPDDDKPGMQVTLGTDDEMNSWSYQTGDNSYTGGCYGKAHWAVISLYRASNCRELAHDAVEQMADGIYQPLNTLKI